MIDYAKKSLEGLWVGDCVGNLGQLYFAHDILKALSEGVAKFGGQLSQYHNQFQYSDDTEEAIVLYNHFRRRFPIVAQATQSIPVIDQDALAMELATRYMQRDPDGEIFGYGLNTRKVLRDIYEGVPWIEANKIIKKSEGMPSHIDSLVNSLSTGENIKDAMSAVNRSLRAQMLEQVGKEKEGSCGNGSAMRVAPLGAFLAQYFEQDTVREFEPLQDFEKRIIAEAALQAEPTHCHPEGIAGSIAIASLAFSVTEAAKYNHLNYEQLAKAFYSDLIRRVPVGQVRDGIIRARDLGFDHPVGKVIEVLGNGQHVTCQDTVPFCCYQAIKYITQKTDTPADIYEKAIIDTSMAFGDVDTNCAIVGGIVGIVCPPPDKWTQFCKPMEDVTP